MFFIVIRVLLSWNELNGMEWYEIMSIRELPTGTLVVLRGCTIVLTADSDFFDFRTLFFFVRSRCSVCRPAVVVVVGGRSHPEADQNTRREARVTKRSSQRAQAIIHSFVRSATGDDDDS